MSRTAATALAAALLFAATAVEHRVLDDRAGAAGAETYSTSIMRPSPMPANGVIAASFPAGETRYYFALDTQPGDLLTQLSFAGREGAGKEVELELLGEAAPTLGEINQRLASSGKPVVVEGHTDAKGADDYNQKLSEDRAGSVKSYLVAHGMPSNRLTIVGWGERKPVAPNEAAGGADDPTGRQKNRRVEIVIDTCA